MGTLQRIIVRLTILASIVSAAPIVGNGTRFSVEQVPINQTSPLSGAQHLAHAYRKYAGVVPTIVALAAAKGSVVATPTNAYDSLYVCPVTIGGQTVNLHFDTGSADLWVFSPDLPQAQQTNHKLYDYKKSSTAKLLSRASWSIQYSDETKAGGLVTEDDVVLGGVTVPAQAIEAADTVSPKFVPRPSDGLMGLSLAVNTVSPQPQQTFLDNLQSRLAQPLFAVDLKYHAPGSYDFGFINPNKHTSAINYTPVKGDDGYWRFTTSGFAFGNGPFKALAMDAIADTGTSLLLLPDSVVDDYYAEFPGAVNDPSKGGFIFPCSSTPPNFTFGVDAHRAVIPGRFMSFGPADGNGNCFGSLQSNAAVGLNILGDIAFKAQFVVFNHGTKQLGFANKTL